MLRRKIKWGWDEILYEVGKEALLRELEQTAEGGGASCVSICTLHRVGALPLSRQYA